MTEKEKTPLELSEQIIKDIEWFIEGHGFCISIASAHYNAKKLHKILSTNNSNNMQSPETPCLEAHIPIVAQKPLGVAAAALGGVRDNSASKNQSSIKGD